MLLNDVTVTDMKKVLVFVILCASGIHCASTQVCGRTSFPPTQRVVGGYVTERRAWPWVVSLNFVTPIVAKPGVKSGHICGGTLVALQWVLTAAHCLDTPGKPNVFPQSTPSEWRITAGMHTRNEEEQKEGNWQTSKVKRFIYHEHFRDYTTHAVHDIALIQLAQPFKYTEYVRPICMPMKRQVKPGWNRCYTAGWGTTNENATRYSLSLNEVPMPVVNNYYCLQAYPEGFTAAQQFCGGDWFKGNMDACKGDSGGPLACQNKSGTWYVAGIISWGAGCGRKLKPGVYTNAQAYENWIYQVARKFTVSHRSARPKANTSDHSRRVRRSVNSADSVILSPAYVPAHQRKKLGNRFLFRNKRNIWTKQHFTLFNFLTNTFQANTRSVANLAKM